VSEPVHLGPRHVGARAVRGRRRRRAT
jgi:hypothetical protein